MIAHLMAEASADECIAERLSLLLSPSLSFSLLRYRDFLYKEIDQAKRAAGRGAEQTSHRRTTSAHGHREDASVRG